MLTATLSTATVPRYLASLLGLAAIPPAREEEEAVAEADGKLWCEMKLEFRGEVTARYLININW